MPDKKEKQTTLGKYTLHEELGRGGFATVYRATHTTLGSTVALKVLSPALASDEKAHTRFHQEAQIASALEHPHIVRILDLDEENGQVFIALEYMPGGDLKNYIQANPKRSQKDLLTLLAQVAQALDYAHSRGVLHRDVKPGNILLDQNGSARLCDFGLVRVAETPRLTQLGSVVGTAAYVSPEQAEGKPLDGRADQYSLAIVAYELLAGQVPFKGENSTATALMHVTQPPPDPASLNPDIPAEAASVLLRGLSKEPEKRFATCLEFVRALEAALEDSQGRRFRELLASARSLLAEGKFAEVRAAMDEARKLLQGRPDMQTALAELDSARKSAELSEGITTDWENASRTAREVLEACPDYPDPQGIFLVLGLRKAQPVRLTLGETARQIGFGLLAGLPLLGLLLYLAFLWITRISE